MYYDLTILFLGGGGGGGKNESGYKNDIVIFISYKVFTKLSFFEVTIILRSNIMLEEKRK